MAAKKNPLFKKITPKSAKAKAKPARRAPSDLETILKGIAELYPVDPSAPGVVQAWIRQRKEFYASIVRYNEVHGGGKQILAAAYADTPEAALALAIANWREGTHNARKLHRFAANKRLPEDDVLDQIYNPLDEDRF